MPGPPPVTPPDGGYEPTLLDRMGPDGAILVRARVSGAIAFLVLFPVLVAASGKREFTAGHPFLTGLVGALAGAFIVYWLQMRLAAAGGAAALAVVFPDGSHTPYEEQYSYEESLAARGDLPAALEAYERVIAEHPDRPMPRLRAAEHYAGRGGNPLRAAELFREVRDLAGVTTRDAVYASSRLVDLYDGPLNAPGRALVELRRIIERYPSTAVALHARDALPRLKARLAAESASRGRGML
jgi:hypothetical protein